MTDLPKIPLFLEQKYIKPYASRVVRALDDTPVAVGSILSFAQTFFLIVMVIIVFFFDIQQDGQITATEASISFKLSERVSRDDREAVRVL